MNQELATIEASIRESDRLIRMALEEAVDSIDDHETAGSVAKLLVSALRANKRAFIACGREVLIQRRTENENDPQSTEKEP